MKQINNRAGKPKSRFTRNTVIASLAMAAVTVASSQAFAAVICASPALNVPNTTAGIYVNFVTGASGVTSTGTPGWDFNPYGSSNTLRFFSSTGAANTTRYVGTGTTADLLASGTMIDATSVLATAGVNPPAAGFLAGVTNGYVGVAFKNEVTTITNFGWASLTTTGPQGLPATVTQYCFQNDGTGIMAGTTPVSLQSYSVD